MLEVPALWLDWMQGRRSLGACAMATTSMGSAPSSCLMSHPASPTRMCPHGTEICAGQPVVHARCPRRCIGRHLDDVTSLHTQLWRSSAAPGLVSACVAVPSFKLCMLAQTHTAQQHMCRGTAVVPFQAGFPPSSAVLMTALSAGCVKTSPSCCVGTRWMSRTARSSPSR